MSQPTEKKKHQRTAKQQAFISAYLENGFNANQAAIAAGYSKKTSRSIGQRLLTIVDIQEAIKERLEKIKNHALATKEGRVTELINHAERIREQLEENGYKEVKETGGQYSVSNEFFDEARYNALLRTYDDIAKEFGDRKQTAETKHSGQVRILVEWEESGVNNLSD